MELSFFIFVVTNACNFACDYCRQSRGEESLDSNEIEQALDFFWPFFSEECYIGFYGGEPLLEFEKIRKAVQYIESKKKGSNNQFHYSLSTNGYLLDDEAIGFFNGKKFSVSLSFDGYAQEVARKKGSFDHCISVIEKIAGYPDIQLKTNSVFGPGTVKYLSESLALITELGITDIRFSFDCLSPWSESDYMQLQSELDKLHRFIIKHFHRNETLPFKSWRKKYRKGMFYCAAGRDRMAIVPNGVLWGCHLFPSYFNQNKDTEVIEKFCFGHLSSFMNKHRKLYLEKLANYSKLVMDNFYTCQSPCILCADVIKCNICPVYAAFVSKKIGKIPVAVCKINKILGEEKERLWRGMI